MSEIKHSDIPPYLCHGMFHYIQATDPTLNTGADVVARETWVDTTNVPIDDTAQLKIRNDGNTDWVNL